MVSCIRSMQHLLSICDASCHSSSAVGKGIPAAAAACAAPLVRLAASSIAHWHTRSAGSGIHMSCCLLLWKSPIVVTVMMWAELEAVTDTSHVSPCRVPGDAPPDAHRSSCHHRPRIRSNNPLPGAFSAQNGAGRSCCCDVCLLVPLGNTGVVVQ